LSSSKEGSIEPRVRECILMLEVYEPEDVTRPARSGMSQQVCLAIRTWQELAQAIYQYEMHNPNAHVNFYDLPRVDVQFVIELIIGTRPETDPQPRLEEIKQRLLGLHPPNRYPFVRAWVRGCDTSAQAAALSAQVKPNQRIQVLQLIRRCGDYGATRDEVLTHFES
jgi:hypothetical protein